MVTQPATDKPISHAVKLQTIWEKYRFTISLLLVGIGMLFGLIVFPAPADRTGYLIELYSSALNIFAAVLIIDYLNRRRDDQRKEQDLKNQLLRDAGSRLQRLQCACPYGSQMLQRLGHNFSS